MSEKPADTAALSAAPADPPQAPAHAADDMPAVDAPNDSADTQAAAGAQSGGPQNVRDARAPDAAPAGPAGGALTGTGEGAGPHRNPQAGHRLRRPLALPAAQGSSWFRIGFGLGLGAVVAWLLVRTVLRISELLTLLLLAVFIAVSLEPVVAWLCRLGLRRGWSVAAVLAGFAGLLAGFLALVIPPVTAAVNALTDAVPRWRGQLRDHHSTLGRLQDHYHLVERARAQLGSGGASELAGGVLGAGRLVVSAVTSAAVVITVTLYVMAALPAIKRFGYRFVPGTRRPRAEILTEEILTRVGRFMLGNIVTSAIAGAAAFVWCEAVGVPYPAALGFFVALTDMVPLVGSTVGAVVVSLVALTVSLPVAVATTAFCIGFRIAEDYLIMPRAMKFAVNVHPVVTVVAVLAGGSLLGVIGGLVAIPAAVALGILLDECVFPRTDAS